MFSASLRLMRPLLSRSAMIELAFSEEVWACTDSVQAINAVSVVLAAIFSKYFIVFPFQSCSPLDVFLTSPIETGKPGKADRKTQNSFAISKKLLRKRSPVPFLYVTNAQFSMQDSVF